jgi:GH24 family phage-related lysozyme (muramidase)
MTYALSAAGLEMIQEFEGFRAEPTSLGDGSWVVGYAHVRVGGAGDAVSQEDATKLLEMDLAPFERAVNESVTTPLTQSQFDALVSFAFSIGADAFINSGVLRRLNKGELVAAACAMDAWRKSEVEGELEIVESLVLRRAAEKAMFLKGVARDAAPSVLVRAKLDHAASILSAPIKYASATVSAPQMITQSQLVAVEAPVESPVLSAAQRLTQILESEPATALVLTQVVTAEEIELEDEIVTAHARPVARKIEPLIGPLPLDRRISRVRKGDGKEGPGFALPHFDMPRTFENVGLLALMVFGLALTWLAGSMLFDASADVVSYAAAGALALPGLAATLLSAYGMLRKPSPSLIRSAA